MPEDSASYQLLLEIRQDVAVLKSHVIGNGAPGLIRRVSEHMDHDDERIAAITQRLTSYDSTIALAKWGIPLTFSAGPIIAAFLVKWMA